MLERVGLSAALSIQGWSSSASSGKTAASSPPPEGGGQSETAGQSTGRTESVGQLSEDEKRQVAELKSTDRKVRQHEQAHLTAGAGVITRGAQFEYQRGPDGQLYAVGGDVEIDTAEVPRDPRATVRKMERVQRAALAPSDPSAQDRRVASEARNKSMKAQLEIAHSASAASGRATTGTAASGKANEAAAAEPAASTTGTTVEKAYGNAPATESSATRLNLLA